MFGFCTILCTAAAGAAIWFAGMDLIYATVYYAFRLLQRARSRSMLTRWSEISASTAKHDVIILHCFEPATTIPNLSGFVMKLQTYMRMAGIPYDVDTTEPLGPKGKSPWISYNGRHYTDSTLIIEWLQEQFPEKTKALGAGWSAEQRALATVSRVTLDEHIFWGFSIWAFWHDPSGYVYKIMPRLRSYEYAVLSYNVRQISWGHGIGRHSPAEIVKLLSESIRAVSTLLGEKEYLLGDRPCPADAALFGFFSQIVWGLGGGPNSPYTQLLAGDGDSESGNKLPNITNITAYCERVRDRFWPDWDDKCLAVK